ncbi:fructose-bisphosphate aldolase class I [Candidatus Saccharibacteria bacterium]|nr:fructose-bisphosphate aldolase class I [Candidatus Saccharibacteria bacterium]
MHRVTIVGNVSKDIYLRLDKRSNQFETDARQVEWLDLAFDGSTHNYYSRVAIYGGASISLEVLTRFGLQANISGTEASFQDGTFVSRGATTTYRYLLCKDDAVSYFVPKQSSPTQWQRPESEHPDWLYIDCSANLTSQLSDDILDYLNEHPSCKLAMFVCTNSNQYALHTQKLAQCADFIITNTVLRQPHPHVATISQDHIDYNGKRIDWSLNEKGQIITDFSSRLAIGASLLAAIILGKSPTEALLLAKANVESARLSGTCNLDTLNNAICGNDYQVQNHKETNTMSEIEQNAKQLMTRGKGILAADESGGSIHKKFESMNIPDDERHRRDYRNIFFTTPELEQYINGVILFDETARQHADDGSTFIEFLRRKGILAGIKVDQGLVNFDNSAEKYTQGLDGLPERLQEYYQMGARFAKWRAAFEMNRELKPSDMAITKNAEILAQYAHDCQTANIVPIVEPELVYDGYYTIEENASYTGKILDALFAAMHDQKVQLSGAILKVNMILAGKQFEQQSSPEEVGHATAEVFRQHIPRDLAGIVFLSGGQSVEQATANLRAVTNCGPFPWPVTFSYARALQDPALHAWQGNNDNADAARAAFKERLIANCAALHKQ